MTREEKKNALHCLKVMIDEEVCEECDLYGTTGTDHCEADCVRVAIEALEQEPCDDEYIKVPKKALKYRTAGMVAYNAEWLKNNFDIERTVICGAQEPCEDAISRQAALGCCRNEWEEEVEIRLKSLPSVNPQEPKILETIDFAIDASNGDTNYFVGFRNGLRYSKSLIDGKEPQFESCTEQEPKTGHWIKHEHNGIVHIECSECFTWFLESHLLRNSYCPNCGAKMVEPQERSE